MLHSCFNPRVREGRDLKLYKRLAPAFVFQSTRPRGTRRQEMIDDAAASGFNPRVREGRDHILSILSSIKNCFNPRVREGRDRESAAGMAVAAVSIHASARDATLTVMQSLLMAMFQSTRPRGTRLLHDARSKASSFVSIHASARDATPSPQCSGSVRPVSIHASARDATACARWSRRTASFQSTRPRGTRQNMASLPEGTHVSIHASARDATREKPSRKSRASSFNPRVREGRDQINYFLAWSYITTSSVVRYS